MVRCARELVASGEKAVVVFTKGMHLEFDVKENFTCQDWHVLKDQFANVHKVIIYWRSSDPIKNEVYVGDFEGSFPCEDQPRLVFNISGLRLKGKTYSNWVQFGGKNSQPLFFVRN